MGKITDVPSSVSNAGQNKNYTAPTPVSVVLVNAPLDAGYVNIALNQATVDSYISGEISGGRAAQRSLNMWDPSGPLILDIGLESAVNYNYVRITVGGRKWYAFAAAQYRNLTSSQFDLQIDAWTTYQPSIGYSQVERGHVAVAASQNDTAGNDYLDAPEPISAPPVDGVLGATIGDADPSSWKAIVISANSLNVEQFEPHENAVVRLTADTYNDFVQGMNDTYGTAIPGIPDVDPTYPWRDGNTVYVPRVVPVAESTIDGVPAGGGVYVFTVAGLTQYLSIMQNAPWVTNGISAIHLVPGWSVDGGAAGGSPVTPPTSVSSGLWDTARAIPQYVSNVVTHTTGETVLNGWRDSFIANYGVGNYRKLVTSQFCSVELSNGESLTPTHPEFWNGAAISVNLTSEGAHGTNVILRAANYSGPLGSEVGVTIGAGGNTSAPMAGWGINTNGAAVQANQTYSAVYQGIASVQAMVAGYNLANEALFSDFAMTLTGAGSGAATGAIGGAMAGGPGGAVVGAALGVGSTVIQAGGQLAIGSVKAKESLRITGLQLGNGVGSAIKSLNAQVQTARGLSGHAGTHNIAGAWQAVIGRMFKVVVKGPRPADVRSLVSQWRRYGYMIGRAFVPPRLDPMDHYSYWKMTEATVVGAMPQNERMAVAEAFERGTTVWTNVAEIGSQPGNSPRSGISY